ncbi:hypothetical protein JRQ81_003199 [Phrynocephalus forsythii]|uniref:Uncharacterized protein n=1 Tax=Phrynocephalus forsythii TaxID=171643 RepID=A0A9Q0XMM6_9SAUR|nr:hypothetical protein JRQ81_003199 [Phrynocephalus forsythii]
MQAESGIVPDFEVGEEFHEEPKTYYELKSQPLKNRLARTGGVPEAEEALPVIPCERGGWQKPLVASPASQPASQQLPAWLFPTNVGSSSACGRNPTHAIPWAAEWDPGGVCDRRNTRSQPRFACC